MFTTILFVALIWFIPGYIAARHLSLLFEMKFGSGVGGWALPLIVFILGPAGLFAELLPAFDMPNKQAWKNLFRNQYTTTRAYFNIDRPRSVLASFFLLGVKDLPVYKATWGSTNWDLYRS